MSDIDEEYYEQMKPAPYVSLSSDDDSDSGSPLDSGRVSPVWDGGARCHPSALGDILEFQRETYATDEEAVRVAIQKSLSQQQQELENAFAKLRDRIAVDPEPGQQREPSSESKPNPKVASEKSKSKPKPKLKRELKTLPALDKPSLKLKCKRAPGRENEKENSKSGPECPVCMEAYRDSGTAVYVPPRCGHVICGLCRAEISARLQENTYKCPVCSAKCRDSSLIQVFIN